MSNNLKPGDKFLLPVTFDDYSLQYEEGHLPNGTAVLLIGGEITGLIPASTLTDLQAENARLRTALTDIVTYVERSNPWDIEAGVTYGIAVEALAGGVMS